MNATVIKLTEQAHIEGYEGATLRIYNAAGKEQPEVIWDNWYEAKAKGEDNNDYTVYWALEKEYTPEDESDEDQCDWENPVMVLDEEHRDVKDIVEIKF